MEDVIFAGTRDRKPLGMACRHHDAGRSLRRTSATMIPRTRQNGHTNGNGHARSQTERSHHHAPPLPIRRKRIPDRRQAGPPARHPGSVHRHRAWSGKLRHHRAGPHRPDPQQQAAGSPGHHRRSRRHRQVQDQEAAGRSETRRRQAESVARVRHSGRSQPAGEFAQAPGFQGAALRRAEGAR